jgi:hypothetical protein
MVIDFLLLPADKQNRVFRQKMANFYGKSGMQMGSLPHKLPKTLIK